ncbi:MAG: hypothetical protein K6E62_00220 [Lachnospiraceae bacterium]|nr:hypothetical protein [Lachnospiraceae bacterium]
MKAWTVSDNNGGYGTAIIFAETRGKAISYAVNCCDTFEGYEWTDIRARRFKEWDRHYKGEPETDVWNDDEARIELVRDYGWSCVETFWEECKECPAREWCSSWEEE